MKTITLELPDELHQQLQSLADSINATIEDTIVAILCKYLSTMPDPDGEQPSPEKERKLYDGLTDGQRKAYDALDSDNN